MDNIRTFLQPGFSLPSSLRWFPALLFLAALVTVTLVACGGGSSEQPDEEATAGTQESSPEATLEPTSESTSDVRTERREDLTTEEYVQALEEIAAAQEEKIEAAGEALFSGALISRDDFERIGSLEASESWSDEDVEFASDLAETMLGAVTGLFGDFLTITRDSLDEISSLTPPEHLTDLHDDYVATSREVLQFAHEFVDGVQDTDTNVGNREELASFFEVVNSLEFGPPSLDLEERAGEACLALTRQVEAELERDVTICDTEAAEAREAARSDREALIALYNATDGPNWTNNDNWLSDEPVYEWYGVRAYGEDTGAPGRVVELVLVRNGLKGEIPAELGQLSLLRSLHLSNNDLGGEIPAELSQLTSLGGLYLNDNSLSGEIPAELGQLTSLTILYLNDNNLSGEIPVELGQLSDLYDLRLAGNNLSGCVPDVLQHLFSGRDFDRLGLPSC